MNSFMPGKHCNLYYGEPIGKWDEALPLGNGHSGCLLWGGSDMLRLSLDRGDLWDKRGAPEIYAQDFKYSSLIDFVEKKDFESVNKKFDEFYFKPTPTKIPAGKILLKFGRASDKFEATLDISNAVAETRLLFGESSTSVKVFVHATKHIGYIEIKGSEAFPEVEIKTPGFGVMENGDESSVESSEKGISNGSLKQLRYPSAVWGEQGELRWFTQKTAEELEYSIIVGQRAYGDKTEIVYAVAANTDSEDRWLEKAMELVRDTLADGFDKSCEEHGRWWSNFWSKSSISLPDKEFEKQWYLTNYLFGSSSRKGCYPMPLQGVWTADNDELPPWKGDYHHDLNTQMSYWHYCKANHMEEGESFIDFLLKTAEAGRKFAREFFDAPGLCLPSVMSIDGKALGGWPMYCLTLTNQAWLCQSFVNHWLYSGDMEFLREKAYPYIRESAICIRRWLKPDASGKLLLPLSSSPELHDNLPEAWVTPNSNYDLSLLIYLFKSLKSMAGILGLEEADSWNEVLEALPELAVNEKNVLMISPDESLKESQRHLAHIMAVYPLKLMDYNGSIRERKIIDASVVDLEMLGTGLWVGFSFPWMAELYAIQKNGEGAGYQLKLFWENFCSSNGFHLNGDYKRRGLCCMHYRPFTLEGNMAAADALQEMLLYTDRGIIRAFPAVPDAWKKEGTAFRSLRGEKGVLISASLKEGKIEYIELRAEHTVEYEVENKFGSNRLEIQRANGVEQIECMEGSTFKIALCEGEIINIKALGDGFLFPKM